MRVQRPTAMRVQHSNIVRVHRSDIVSMQRPAAMRMQGRVVESNARREDVAARRAGRGFDS